jgi:hypothetical protein
VGGKSSSPIETRPTLNTNTTNNRNSRLHYRAFRDQGKHKYFPTELFLPIPNYYTVVQRKNIFEIIFLKSKEMIEFAIVTVKTGASVTHWVRYSSIISNSMAESVTSASFVLGADQRQGSNVLIVAHRACFYIQSRWAKTHPLCQIAHPLPAILPKWWACKFQHYRFNNSLLY